MRKTILEKLADGELCPGEEEMINKSEYKTISEKFSKDQERLLATFSEEQKILYDECISQYDDMHFLGESDYLFKGFKLGTLLMTEMLYRKE